MNQRNDVKLAKQAGFVKNGRARKSLLELGAKHAAKVGVRRVAKQQLGQSLAADIVSLLARKFISKL